MPVERSWSSGWASSTTASQFDMTAFCLRMSNGANAVSQLHAETANATWQRHLERPILGITNGVHMPTWIGNRMREQLEHHLDADLDTMADDTQLRRFWERIERVPAPDLWEAHSARSWSSRSSRAAGCAASSPATARRRRRSRSSRTSSTRRS